MNILIFSKHYSPEPFLIHSLSKELSKKKTNVYVLTSQPSYPFNSIYKGYKGFSFSSETLDGIHIYRVPTIPRLKTNSLLISLNYFCFFFFSMFFGIYLAINKKINIIFVYATSPMIQAFFSIPAKLFSNAKMVVWIQDLTPDDIVNSGFISNVFFINFIKKIVDSIYINSELLLIQSRALKKSINKLHWKKVIFYPNPVFNSYSQSIPKNVKLHIDNIFIRNKFYITFAGNIGISQDINSLISVAQIFKSRRLNKFHFLVFGDGSLEKELKVKILEYNLTNISLGGFFDKSAMPYIYMKSDCLYSTLLDRPSFSKIVPYRVHDYLTSGKPLITGINGEVFRLVKTHNLGVACPAEDPAALARGIIRISSFGARELRAIHNNSLSYVKKNLEITKQAIQLYKLFKALIK